MPTEAQNLTKPYPFRLSLLSQLNADSAGKTGQLQSPPFSLWCGRRGRVETSEFPGDDSNWEVRGPQGLPPKSHNWALVRICRHHPCPGRCDLRYRMLSLPVWGSHLRSDACSLPPHFHYLSLGNPI